MLKRISLVMILELLNLNLDSTVVITPAFAKTAFVCTAFLGTQFQLSVLNCIHIVIPFTNIMSGIILSGKLVSSSKQ